MVTNISFASPGVKTIGVAWAGSPAGSVAVASALRKSVVIFNNSSSTVYLGTGTGVIDTSGYPLLSYATLTDEDSSDDWYAYIGTGSADIRYIETNVKENQ